MLFKADSSETIMIRFCYNLCTYHDNFGYRHKLLVDRPLSQGYKVNRLRNSFQTFYGRHPDLVGKYQKSVRNMLNDSFSFYKQLHLCGS